jgi:hypothetical protein
VDVRAGGGSFLRGRRLTVSVLVVCVIAGLALWALFADRKHASPPRQRVYSAYSACLLVGPGGLSGPGVAPVGSGLEDGSIATSAKVSYLAVVGAESPDNVSTYVSTLVVRKCDLVVGVGSAETAALLENAAANPTIHFAVVGASAQSANVASVATPDARDVRGLVKQLLVRAYHGGFTGGPVT